ncbi:MAG TPA: F0F1 ATP synthase subunit B' [Campylobacterales bacterium]|nr:F0F1 ATP synthase subunit B' [Campylobacterales bacterium]HIO71294.1 F0F1 ATP synthase subunit B' [Campylobacterales bacterium]
MVKKFGSYRVLDISPILLLSTLVVFICLIRYLNRNLYQPMLEYMENRDSMVQSDIDTISKNHSDAEKFHQEANDVLVQAREEATSIREAVIAEVKEAISAELEAKREELAKSYQQFEKELESERVSLKNRLLADSDSIAQALKERLTSI